MRLDARHRQLLRTVVRRRTRAQLKRLFAVVRAHDDRALLAAFMPTKKKVNHIIDPLVRELELTLRPVLAPAAEKAELLIEHLSKKHRRKLTFQAKGLADAARRCRAAKLSDEQIRAGAESLVAQLARLHGRETVV